MLLWDVDAAVDRPMAGGNGRPLAKPAADDAEDEEETTGLVAGLRTWTDKGAEPSGR
jgi:hypothetical protein